MRRARGATAILGIAIGSFCCRPGFPLFSTTSPDARPGDRASHDDVVPVDPGGPRDATVPHDGPGDARRQHDGPRDLNRRHDGPRDLNPLHDAERVDTIRDDAISGDGPSLDRGDGAVLDRIGDLFFPIEASVPDDRTVADTPTEDAETIEPLSRYPDPVFFDWSGRLTSDGYTAEQQQQIAQLGVGIWPAQRVLNSLGADQIAQIRLCNPDFVVLCLWNPMVVDAEEIGAEFPFSNDLRAIYLDHLAQHLDGTPVRRFPDNPGLPAELYWLNPGVETGEPPYDLGLFEQYLAAIERLLGLFPATTCEGFVYRDQFKPGPLVSTILTDLYGPVDLDQDGIANATDEDEQLAWYRWQLDLVTAIRNRFGPDFIQIGQGSMHLPGSGCDQAMAEAHNGVVIGSFPPSAPGEGALEMTKLTNLYDNAWSEPVRGRRWYIILMEQEPTPEDWVQARIASMLFHTAYTRQSSFSSAMYADDHGIESGKSVNDLLVFGDEATTTYQRTYHLGQAKVIADLATGRITASWTP